jgi:hypothetical protein
MMNAIVTALKNADSDFEFYPTTQAMIDRIKSDMIQHYNTYEDQHTVLSCVNVLDCGAGDGLHAKLRMGGGR